MPLMNCPECGKPVSSSAHACPVCGYPVAEKMADGQSMSAAGTIPSPERPSGELIAEIRPSWWGFFWYLFFFWLLIPPIIGWFRRASTVLRVYDGRITIERGILSKCYQDYNSRDIRSIDIDQSLLQRMVGIGNITISTSATAEGSEQLKSIPDPKGLRDLLLAQRNKA